MGGINLDEPIQRIGRGSAEQRGSRRLAAILRAGNPQHWDADPRQRRGKIGWPARLKEAERISGVLVTVKVWPSFAPVKLARKLPWPAGGHLARLGHAPSYLRIAIEPGRLPSWSHDNDAGQFGMLAGIDQCGVATEAHAGHDHSACAGRAQSGDGAVDVIKAFRKGLVVDAVARPAHLRRLNGLAGPGERALKQPDGLVRKVLFAVKHDDTESGRMSGESDQEEAGQGGLTARKDDMAGTPSVDNRNNIKAMYYNGDVRAAESGGPISLCSHDDSR